MKGGLKDNWPSQVFSLGEKWNEEVVYIFPRGRKANTGIHSKKRACSQPSADVTSGRSTERHRKHKRV